MWSRQQEHVLVGGKNGQWFKVFIRVLQIILGITIAGIYGHDLDLAHRNGAAPSREWVYAVVVGSLSAVTAAFYLLPFIKAFALFYWDLVLVIAHTALIGIFGKAYLGHIPSESGDKGDVGPDVNTMKHAVYLDVVNGILWLLTGIFGFVVLMKVRLIHQHQDLESWGRKSFKQRASVSIVPFDTEASRA